jgi:hypothetical protein
LFILGDRGERPPRSLGNLPIGQRRPARPADQASPEPALAAEIAHFRELLLQDNRDEVEGEIQAILEGGWLEQLEHRQLPNGLKELPAREGSPNEPDLQALRE